jgi:plasmid stabilization system protein ParE
MDVVVIWSDSAIEDLHNIYNFHLINANKRVADRLANSIVDQTLLLEQTPGMGQSEDLLAHLQKEIRFLVHKKYKIVYWIDDSMVTIAAVFDCRQSPGKLSGKNI